MARTQRFERFPTQLKAKYYLEENEKRLKECIIFNISQRGMGIEFYTVRARGIAGTGSKFEKVYAYLRFFLDLIPGFFKSLYILRKKHIDMILGMGGYICAPVILAAMCMKTGFALHEQNYIPGRLNRFFSARALYFFTSFKHTEKYVKGNKNNIVFSGNPVRESIRMLHGLAPDYGKWGLKEDRFTITAFGGSLGAQKINESVLELGDMKEPVEEMQILLITGTRFYDSISRRVVEKDPGGKVDIKVFSYIDDIEEVYRITDLVIARAGASTVFETAAAGIPSILVPYPFAIDDHQSYNARYLQQQGMSISIEESSLAPGMLADRIKDLLKDNRKIYNSMKDSTLEVKSIDSAGVISKKLMEDAIAKQ